jgi:hypothetical protein
MTKEPLYVVFDGPPEPESGRFVETGDPRPMIAALTAALEREETK